MASDRVQQAIRTRRRVLARSSRVRLVHPRPTRQKHSIHHLDGTQGLRRRQVSDPPHCRERFRTNHRKGHVPLRGRYPGRSSDLTRFHSYSDDHIIEPKTGWGASWPAPGLTEKVDDPRKLEWSIGSKSITFR